LSEKKNEKGSKHIVLTSHPSAYGERPSPLQWGAISPSIRGPIVASVADTERRNAIGTHCGSYMIYRALAIASGSLKHDHRPDYTNTSPTTTIGPHPSWGDPEKIVSLDPFGAMTFECFADDLQKGVDIRPTIAITKANVEIPELRDAIKAKRLTPDDKILKSNGACVVTKAAIEPVWHLPGIAKRFGIEESKLRRTLFETTGGMYPELVTRSDLELFLPPIGSITVYFFGDLEAIIDPQRRIACRVHDECNGSDVFGSDICTCRPYLTHGIEVCIEEAQKGGVGIIVYNRKEGRGLGEVTKFLVYNARKRQQGGDRAETYFERTECIAGVQDVRFQELMPDILHWMGVTKIDRFVSMSDMKYNAIIKSGIEINERVSIPDGLIPADASVEMDAKKAAGYYSEVIPHPEELKKPKGRDFTS